MTPGITDGVELVDPRCEGLDGGLPDDAMCSRVFEKSLDMKHQSRSSLGPGGIAEQGGKRIRLALGVGKGAKASKYAELPENEVGSYALPAKPTCTDYAMHPVRGFRQFAQLLISNFGGSFVGMIVCNYLVKGLLQSILGLARLSYCKKTLGVDGAQCQTIGAIASTPWAIKGALGVISDAYPLFGYHKASYIICTAVMGSTAYFLLASLPAGPLTAALLLFLANLQISTADLLCEGKYASLMQVTYYRLLTYSLVLKDPTLGTKISHEQAKPKTGSAMVSLVWGCFQMGSLIAACLVGPVADKYNPQAYPLLLALLLALLLFTFLLAHKYKTRFCSGCASPSQQASYTRLPSGGSKTSACHLSSGTQFTCFTGTKVLASLVQKHPTSRGWF